MSHAPDVPFFKASHRITQRTINNFGELVNDLNPIHIDDEAAQAAGFIRTIAHGMLVGSYISGALTECYGKGTVYVKQDLKFIKPVYSESYIVIHFLNEHVNTKNRLELETRVYTYPQLDDPVGVLHVIGHAEVIPGKGMKNV